jgi:serine/threonine protein kinase
VSEPGLSPGLTESERFEIENRLGQGGYGVVYRAYDRQRHAHVALKLLARRNIGDLYRFKQEFRTLSDLSHPNLVSLYELLFDRDQWFIVMELVDGTDFIHHVWAGPEGEPVNVDWALSAAETTLARTHPTGEASSQLTTSPAPGPTPTNLPRLQQCLSQLARALRYLHSAGKLHRDIKPSNVLVTTAGHVKVLDFGLAIDIASDSTDETVAVIGTPAYMSPEQLSGRPLTEASDWYSLGVMLYCTLTGALPFTGSVFETLQSKMARGIAPPHAVVPSVARWLSNLTWDLLAPRPEDRPLGEEVLARIAAHGGESPAVVSTLEPGMTPQTFVGRRRQLDALANAYETAKSGRAVIAHVHGSSGIGKTALLQHFFDELRARDKGVVVLKGRCYERESVPYKAFDNIVDRLSRYVSHLRHADIEAMLPRDVRALARLFPMLEQIPAVARATRRGSEIKDAQELRRRGFTAFRELMGRLSDRRPVVLSIDDFQWGDADSVMLLTDLMRPPNPPSILLVLSYRVEETNSSTVLRELLKLRAAPSPELEVLDLEVGELGSVEAHELAVALLKSTTAESSALAEIVASESHGSPFILDALIRHGQAVGRVRTVVPHAGTDAMSPIVDLSVDSLLRDRIATLSPAARRLVEVLAVFGQPLAASVAARTAELGADELDVIAALRAARLTRTRLTDAGEQIEIYHDRIRETVASQLSPPMLKGYHGRLARVLEDAGWSDPETLSVHFSEAGDDERAGVYALLAADRARETLAFDRAARLYRRALELGGKQIDATAQRIRVSLGDVLANAGRGHEAATAYLAAADGALAAERLELHRRAAHQLLRSGYVEEGFTVTRSVLDAIGIRLARTPLQALLAFLVRRAQIRWRGLGFQERDRSQISTEELVRVDACWSVAIGLGVVDTVRAADFQTRHLLLALKTGELLRVARALATEVTYAALGGPRTRSRTERLAAIAERVAARVKDPTALALLTLAKGTASYFQGGWTTTRDLLRRADAILREQCTDVTWELDTAHFYLMLALFYLGELRDLRVHVPILLKEADERDDLTGTTNLRTRVLYLISLADDDPELALAEVQRGMARWPRNTFHTQHSWELYAQGEILLYEGRYLDGYDQVESNWPALRRSFLLQIQNVRIEFCYLRARCALGASLDPATRPDRRSALSRAARRDIRRLAHERSPWAAALAALVGAAGEAAEGRRSVAMHQLESAEAAFTALDMPLHASVAKRQRGVLAGSEGRDLVEQADDWMREQMVRNPAKFAAMLAPGFVPSREAETRVA